MTRPQCMPGGEDLGVDEDDSLHLKTYLDVPERGVPVEGPDRGGDSLRVWNRDESKVQKGKRVRGEGGQSEGETGVIEWDLREMNTTVKMILTVKSRRSTMVKTMGTEMKRGDKVDKRRSHLGTDARSKQRAGTLIHTHQRDPRVDRASGNMDPMIGVVGQAAPAGWVPMWEHTPDMVMRAVLHMTRETIGPPA